MTRRTPPNMTNATRRGPRAPRGWAFTLIELLIAVSIIALASVLLLPGFTRIIASNNYSSAINLTTSALGQARALAIRNSRYTGVMFTFDYTTEKCRLQVIELLSSGGTGYLTSSVAFQTQGAYCQPYRAAEGQAPIELPPGFCVYAMSFGVTRTVNPDNSNIPTTSSRSPILDNGANGSGPTRQWYAGEIAEEGVTQNSAADRGESALWIPPRNDPTLYTTDGANPWLIQRSQWGGRTQEFKTAVRHAQSFAIFFDPVGAVVTATSEGAEPLHNAYLEIPNTPYDRTPPAPGPRVAVDRINVFDPEFAGNPAAVDPTPNPEVRLRAATALAVVDVSRLSKDVGLPRAYLARPEVRDPTKAAPKRTNLETIAVPGINSAYFSNVMAKRISGWIDRNAEVLTLNRFTGAVNRRAGS